MAKSRPKAPRDVLPVEGTIEGAADAAAGDRRSTVTSSNPGKRAKRTTAPKPGKAAKEAGPGRAAAKAEKAKGTKQEKAARKAAKATRVEKPAKPEKPAKGEKPAKVAKREKPAKRAKATKASKVEQEQGSAKAAKPGKSGQDGESEATAPQPASLPSSFVDQAGQLAAAAGAILGEVAGLVRQAAEPAAGRIVELVARTVESRSDPEQPAELRDDAGAEPAPLARPPTAGPAAADPDPAAGPDHSAAAEPPLDVQPGARIAASIDVGTTSVHLLVAAVGNHRVVPMLDESVFLGLGDRVGTDGRFGPAAREDLVAAIASYVDAARRLGADPITVVGTEPLRRADDAAAAVHAVTARSGVAFHVVDHDEEGLLTLLGVTGGRPLAAATLVVDIGGGSSEIVVTEPDGTVLAGGLPLGAAGLTRELVHADPPTLTEIEALRARIREEVAQLPDLRPGEIVAVGGTASNLLKLLPATAIDRMLTRRRITVALAMLTVERSAEAAARHLIRPERARILPAGALIVDAILERFGADRLRVSEDGIRSGLLLATTAAGGAWRDRLPRLAGGWESSPLD